MRVVCSLFLSALLSIACTAYAQNDTRPYQIDKQATAQAPWKVGDVITKDEKIGLYRKFIGMTSQGYYVVQDFYQKSNKKYSAPFAIVQRDLAVNIKQTYSSEFQPKLINGMMIIWYENGQKEVEGLLQNGQKQGLWIWWNKNGKKEEETQYLDGLEEGLSSHWDQYGQKWLEGQYQGGEKHGLWTEWYRSNGQKDCEGQYRDGKLQGLWTNWDRDGKKISEMVFEAGKLVSEKNFE